MQSVTIVKLVSSAVLGAQKPGILISLRLDPLLPDSLIPGNFYQELKSLSFPRMDSDKRNEFDRNLVHNRTALVLCESEEEVDTFFQNLPNFRWIEFMRFDKNGTQIPLVRKTNE